MPGEVQQLLPRFYDAILRRHFARYRQMAFVAGPRQVGKTTTCRSITKDANYYNWDNQDHRRLILKGPAELVKNTQLELLANEPRTLIFDEIHKYGKWKTFIKGLFDQYEQSIRIIVTGSSRLDVYRRGGDSLMGRYFLYRMHPFTIGELIDRGVGESEIRPPRSIPRETLDALLAHGGYPEPFVKKDPGFSTIWREMRFQQLVREDIRDLSRITEVGVLESLMTILASRSGTSLVLSNLAQEVNVSVDTVRRWMKTLTSVYFGFAVAPWYRNVAKSLRKAPKWYSFDWAAVDDPGRRAETFVACHLLKSVNGWQDLGLGKYELYYLRDKLGREVDFLVVKNRKPWFMVEVKTADASLSEDLYHFQKQTKAQHAFQAVLSLDHAAADAFLRTDPCVVPATTLLSQLL